MYVNLFTKKQTSFKISIDIFFKNTMKTCKQQNWNFGSFSNLVKFWCLLLLCIVATFFGLLLLLSGESDKQMYHLMAGVKAAPRGLLAPALD